MNSSRVLSLVLLVLVLVAVSSSTASIPVAQASDGAATEWMQGESVRYNVEIPGRVPDEIFSIYSSDGGTYREGQRSCALVNDGQGWFVEASATDGTTDMWVNGYFYTPYTSVDELTVEVNVEGTGSGHFWLFPNNVPTGYAFADGVTATQAVDSTYIRNDKIEFNLRIGTVSGGVAPLTHVMDQFFLSFNNVSGTVRSQYYIQDPTSTLHKVTIVCFDYGVTIQLYVPTGWDYQSSTPSATVTEAAGNIIVTNTIPTTYEFFFTSDESKRIGNVVEVATELFESGVNFAIHEYISGAPTKTVTRTYEYQNVFEGASSFEIYSSWTGAGPWGYEGIELPFVDADYLMVSLYVEENTNTASNYIRLVYGSYTGNFRTSTPLGWGEWQDVLPIGSWVTLCLNVSDNTATTPFRISAVSGNGVIRFQVDNIRFFTTTLDSSDPVEGTAVHMSPYGLYTASQKEANWLLLNSTNDVASSGTITTDLLGEWSEDLGLTTAGTYRYYPVFSGHPSALRVPQSLTITPGASGHWADGGYDFENTGYATYAAFKAMNGINAVTIVMWFRPSELADYIFGEGTGTYTSSGAYISGGNQRLYIQIANNTHRTYASTPALTLGNLYCGILTWTTGGKATVYLNGTIGPTGIAGDSMTGSITNNGQFYLGAAGGGGGPHNGTIYSFSVYNFACSQTQIDIIQSLGPDGVFDGNRYYWTLDEGAGTTLGGTNRADIPSKNTLIVQQLGFASADLVPYSSDQYRLDITGAAYADQVYNVSLSGVWFVGLGDGDLVEVNTTLATHAYTVYAVDREQGFLLGDIYYVYLEASGAGSYLVQVTSDPLNVTRFIFSHDAEYCTLDLETNWGNTTVTIYQDGQAVISAELEGHFTWDAGNTGNHNVTVIADGGGESVTKTQWYRRSEEPVPGAGGADYWSNEDTLQLVAIVFVGVALGVVVVATGKGGKDPLPLREPQAKDLYS